MEDLEESVPPEKKLVIKLKRTDLKKFKENMCIA